jgi:hypothetical protein
VKRKQLKNVLAILCFILTVAFLVSAKEKIVDSLWANSPLEIDGFVNEWSGDSLSFEKKTKVDYAFRNDADFLYVFFRFNDLQYLSTIETTGMTFWINTQEKKKKPLGLNFTKKRFSTDDYIVHLEKHQGLLSSEQKEQLHKSAFYVISHAEVIDKKGESLYQGTKGQSVGGCAHNVSVQQDLVVYEFRVPVRSLTESILGKAIQPGELLKVGFEWGGLTDELRSEYLKGRASGEGSGAIGISEGGKGGGASGVGFSGASPRDLTALRKMTKKYSFWVDVHLAKDETG